MKLAGKILVCLSLLMPQMPSPGEAMNKGDPENQPPSTTSRPAPQKGEGTPPVSNSAAAAVPARSRLAWIGGMISWVSGGQPAKPPVVAVKQDPTAANFVRLLAGQRALAGSDHFVVAGQENPKDTTVALAKRPLTAAFPIHNRDYLQVLNEVVPVLNANAIMFQLIDGFCDRGDICSPISDIAPVVDFDDWTIADTLSTAAPVTTAVTTAVTPPISAASTVTTAVPGPESLRTVQTATAYYVFGSQDVQIFSPDGKTLLARPEYLSTGHPSGEYPTCHREEGESLSIPAIDVTKDGEVSFLLHTPNAKGFQRASRHLGHTQFRTLSVNTEGKVLNAVHSYGNETRDYIQKTGNHWFVSESTYTPSIRWVGASKAAVIFSCRDSSYFSSDQSEIRYFFDVCFNLGHDRVLGIGTPWDKREPTGPLVGSKLQLVIFDLLNTRIFAQQTIDREVNRTFDRGFLTQDGHFVFQTSLKRSRQLKTNNGGFTLRVSSHDPRMHVWKVK